MPASYPATYTDQRGSEAIKITNEGTWLTFTLRGVHFETDLEDFAAVEGTDPERMEQFERCQYGICSCQFDFTIPITVSDSLVDQQAALNLAIFLGAPDANGRLRDRKTIFTLRYGSSSLTCSNCGDFEDALLKIQAQLPDAIYMKSCINCAYSDYSPFGNQSFGSMMCFRNIKQKYLRAKGKDGILDLHDEFKEVVQETHLCDEFERRVSGTGYRG